MIWRAEGLSWERWNHTAQLAYLLAAGLLKGHFRPADFHPYLRHAEEVRTIPMDAEKPIEFPTQLAEGEVERQWKQFCERHPNA